MHHVFWLKMLSTVRACNSNARVFLQPTSERCFKLLKVWNKNVNNVVVRTNWNRTFTSAVHKQGVDGLHGNKRAGNEEVTFEELFKVSKFVDMLDPVGKIVDGKIIAVDGPNLYVDFGGKFHGVAIRPRRFGERYVKGTRVKVLIKDLEIGMHFLGSNMDTSLLEASIEIVGLL